MALSKLILGAATLGLSAATYSAAPTAEELHWRSVAMRPQVVEALKQFESRGTVPGAAAPYSAEWELRLLALER